MAMAAASAMVGRRAEEGEGVESMGAPLEVRLEAVAKAAVGMARGGVSSKAPRWAVRRWQRRGPNSSPQTSALP